MKKLSGGIRTALAQYRELAAFSQFASDLDDATRKQLDHGQKVTELLETETVCADVRRAAVSGSVRSRTWLPG
ncbi:hypothetical protein LNP74_12855 [Klebsiella pneumoniae subsp. pneumoniae]|nr:hypothetical protein [Klebsiella pneumoniae subsp. pneumoniae]